MIRRLVILDVGLVLLLVFGIAKFREDWLAFEPTHQVSAIQARAENLPGLPAPGAASAPSGDWTEIPTKNPFSFDRNDIAVLAPPPEAPKPVGPKPVLFGTMLLGQGWTAMLASGQTNNRNSRPVRVGQSIDGWTVVEISEKSVVVESNSNRQTLTTNDWVSLQIPRDSARTLASGAAPVVQSVMPAPAVAAPPTGASPSSAAEPDGSNARGGTPCVRELKTPFGTVRQPCDDPRR
jgi:hypothetical protein